MDDYKFGILSSFTIFLFFFVARHGCGVRDLELTMNHTGLKSKITNRCLISSSPYYHCHCCLLYVYILDICVLLLHSPGWIGTGRLEASDRDGS